MSQWPSLATVNVALRILTTLIAQLTMFDWPNGHCSCPVGQDVWSGGVGVSLSWDCQIVDMGRAGSYENCPPPPAPGCA